jgi:hypothetical protein
MHIKKLNKFVDTDFLKLKKTVYILILLSLQIHGSDTISNSYNLGKLPSGGLIENALAWSNFSSRNMTLDYFHFRTKAKKNVSFGMTPAIWAFSTDPKVVYFQYAPEMDLSWRSQYSNRCNLSLMPLTFYNMKLGSYSFSGFDQPFVMLNNFQWNYLSRQGKITVEPDQYESAFRNGPLLNPGQIRNEMIVQHTINGDTIPYRKFNIQLTPEVGLTKFMKIYGLFCSSYQDSVTGFVSGYTSERGDYSTYLKNEFDSTNVGLGLDLRFGNLVTTLGGNRESFTDKRTYASMAAFDGGLYYWERSIKKYVLYCNLSHITGSRIQSSGEIEGNWDQFESRWIGKGQLLNKLSVSYTPFLKMKHYNNLIENLYELDVNQHTRYGFCKYLDIGERFSYTYKKHSNLFLDEDDGVRYGISLTSCNIPLRDYGPDASTDQEYFHGRTLKKKQYFTEIVWFPIRNNKMYGSRSIIEILYPSSQIGNTAAPRIIRERNHFTNGDILSSNDLLDRPELSVEVAWAPLNQITFVNNFQYKKYSVDYNYTLVGNVNRVIVNYVSTIITLSNSFKMNFTYLYAYQSDKYVPSSYYYKLSPENKYMSVIFGIQASIR